MIETNYEIGMVSLNRSLRAGAKRRNNNERRYRSFVKPERPGSSNVMLYEYTATTLEGELKTGSIEASSADIAISALQARNLIITDIKSTKQSGSIFESLGSLKFFNKVKHKDVVILSRQLPLFLIPK